jgi:uncharacterized membrane protein YfhO
LIGDFLSHEDLLELESERQEYFAKQAEKAIAEAQKAKALA